ncbi:methionyl-tRNA formyltransferase [Pelagibius marinus]|uniref:methionyl-tRNA formyltransferase n=1 Tax=Pelagibius marinus TaxID=2762760 RepID=UPI001872EFE2|nr:methionyl-tRNA formyltransferase [Pelagibius marinus]
MSLRVAFMGTPDFSVPTLKALAEAGHEIAAVYSQPPRPAGRGQKERPSPVQAYAESRGWEVRTPTSLKTPEAQKAFADLNLDIAVVVAYGLILPQAVLDAPRLGCVNVHASLLPRWRGAAPIQRALLAGDEETGVTIMQMEAGLDTGPMLLKRSLPITPETSAQELHDALAALGAAMINEALEGLDDGSLTATPQPEEGVTYAAKLDKAEGRLDWSDGAAALDRRIRAFTPWPGAFFEVGAGKGRERVKVLQAEPREGRGAPGTVLDDQATIACGEGALRLKKVQRAGKAPMAAEAFLRGFDLPAGTVLP